MCYAWFRFYVFLLLLLFSSERSVHIRMVVDKRIMEIQPCDMFVTGEESVVLCQDAEGSSFLIANQIHLGTFSLAVIAFVK